MLRNISIAIAIVLSFITLICLIKPVSKGVRRPIVVFTSDEIDIAKKGTHTRDITMSLKAHHTYRANDDKVIEVNIINNNNMPLNVTGIWNPCTGCAGLRNGLPPEMCYMDYTRSGSRYICNKRPFGPEYYDIYEQPEVSYFLVLAEWGDFSPPGKYTVNLMAKCNIVDKNNTNTTALISSTCEFDVIP